MNKQKTVSDSEYSSMKDLVETMNGNDSTNGWDAVCSYTVKQLNAFLKKSYEEKKLVTNLSFEVEKVDELFDIKYSVKYEIKLASPTLRFIAGESGKAILTMPMESGTSQVVSEQTGPKDPVEIPQNKYSIECVIPLASITGRNETDATLVPHGEAVEFIEGDSEQAHIILNFSNSNSATYKIMPKPDPEDSTFDANFRNAVADYFIYNVSEIDYALAAVNNDLPPDSENITLTPKSFVFDSSGKEESGVLSLYIQILEGKSEPGKLNPSFQPGDTSILPIPQGFTASLILSYGLMTKVYIRKQLEKEGFAVTFQAAPRGRGIFARVSKDVNVVADGGGQGGFVIDAYYFKGLDFNLNDYPMDLIMIDGGCGLGWSASGNSHWQNDPLTGSKHHGDVKLTLSFAKGPEPIALNEDYEMSIANMDVVSKDIDVIKEGKSCHWYELQCSSSVPLFYSEMTFEVPPLYVDMYGLNFFCTTNLLAPGGEMIDFDRDIAVQTPHDFLMVGQLIKN